MRYYKLLNSLDSLNDIKSTCSLILKCRKCLQVEGSIFLAWCSNIQQYSNQQYSLEATGSAKEISHRSRCYNAIWILQQPDTKVLIGFLFPVPNSGGGSGMAAECSNQGGDVCSQHLSVLLPQELYCEAPV